MKYISTYIARTFVPTFWITQGSLFVKSNGYGPFQASGSLELCQLSFFAQHSGWRVLELSRNFPQQASKTSVSLT